MNCPACSAPLQLTERQGVEIDYCPQCRGIWLDRGELDKLIDRSESYRGRHAPSTPDHRDRDANWQRHHDDDDDDDYRQGRKKRRSFLRDLLDFD
ncbi:MAG: zf-TFIIB domain-containing protein [Chthonomonadales bacterium]|nr:zf-TFIIB domain-containing protein [Chthonomonadales bacterium]